MQLKFTQTKEPGIYFAALAGSRPKWILKKGRVRKEYYIELFKLSQAIESFKKYVNQGGL